MHLCKYKISYIKYVGDVQNKQVKMQEEQLEEMQVPGRTLSLAVD